MVQVLVTDDSNQGQNMAVPVPGRSSPLTARAVPASSVVPESPLWGSVAFVDPKTSLTLAQQTGAPSTPFATAQQAADIPGNDGNAIVLGPGDAGDLTLIQRSFVYFGFGLLTQGTLALDRPRIGTVSYIDPALSNNQQRFVNVDVTGTVDLNSEGLLAGVGSYFEGAITGALFANFDGCLVISTVACGQLDAFNTPFQDAITCDFAFVRECTLLGNVTAQFACSFRNCEFPGPITVDAPSISLDWFSYSNALTSGVTFTSVPTIVDAPTGGGFVYYFRYNGTADGTFFAGPSGQGVPVSNEGQASLVAVRAGTLRNLRIHCFNGVISNAAVTFTVRVNGADTGITVTMNPGDTDATDLVNTAALAAGDFVSVGVVGGTNANTPAYTAIAFELV